MNSLAKRREAERRFILNDLQNCPVEASWSDDTSIGKVRLGLKLPYGCTFNAAMGRDDADGNTREMVFLGLRVDPSIREGGIGKRLISALGYVAKQNQIESLSGQANSQYTVMALRRVFGEDSLSFTNADPIDGHEAELPISADEAIALLERSGQFEADLEHRKIGFGVVIDLSRVGVAELEQPYELNSRFDMQTQAA